MARARSVLLLYATLAIAGLMTAAAGLSVAATRVSFALPSLGELAVACRRWALPEADPVSLLVLAMGALGTASAFLVVRSAVRQVAALRRFERRLPVTGRLEGDVRVVDDPRPEAFCAGLLRPRVFVSTGALDALSGCERAAVLAHEAHHRRRRDPLRLLAARAVADGLFFLPALRRLAARYSALTELAADEAAVRETGSPRALAAALLAFDAHPHPGVAGVSPERVDRLAGERARWELPALLLAAAVVTLLALGALTVRLAQATHHASVALPALLADACMIGMALVPLLAAAGAMLGGRRVLARR